MIELEESQIVAQSAGQQEEEDDKSQAKPMKASITVEQEKLIEECDASNSNNSNHSQLKIVKSSDSNQSRSSRDEQEQQSQQVGQQKQMFSLKQLAIQSRNLTKKRPSKTTNQESAAIKSQIFPRLFSANSNCQPCAQEARLSWLAESSLSQDRNQSADAAGGDASDDQVGDEKGDLLSEEEPEEEDDECHQQDVDHQDDEENEEDDDEDEDEEDEEQDDDEDDDSDASNKLEPRTRKQRNKRFNHRRSSSCNCEQLINKIDQDGLPVTDVDLVTYKDLCQMEQQAHYMRTSHRRRRLEAQSTTHSYAARQNSSSRRSSLQEESGAYYQLCTSPEEQEIRHKYVWFPPSLGKLSLVDQFFSTFSKSKIPFALSSISKTTNNVEQVVGQQPAQSQSHPSVASSYRDDQISFQLPRQDISLDYCSYPMTDASRLTYLQFVEKRNVQALDVGYVVKLSLAKSSCSSQKPIPECQDNERRASIASQSGANLVALNQQEQLEQQVAAPCGSQRCRRCLVRFQDQQLAVVAPNFLIGSTVYRSSVIPAGGESTTSVGNLSRRPSSSLGKQVRDQLSMDPPAPPTNAALFHPNCFTCSTCKEFLVDLVYCLRDNKLYCLRHYGESLRPRCSWCQEVSSAIGRRQMAALGSTVKATRSERNKHKATLC